MKLTVLGKPYLCPNASLQKVLVSYNEKNGLTIIDCDVDIVTLGIAVQVLTEQYEQYLYSMSNQQTAAEIREKICSIVEKYTERGLCNG